MSRATEIAKELRDLGKVGCVNYKYQQALCNEAADLIEDQEERIDIMMEGNKVKPETGVQMEIDPYEYRDEIRQG